MAYIHPVTGRKFSTLKEYHDYRKRYINNLYKKMKLRGYTFAQLISHVSNVEQQYARMRRNDTIQELRSKREKIIKDRGIWKSIVDAEVKRSTSDLRQKISEDEIAMNKLKLRIKIQKAALSNFEKEEKEKYIRENPFPRQKELKNIENKIYRL